MGLNLNRLNNALENHLNSDLSSRGFELVSNLKFSKELSPDVILKVSFNVKGYEPNDFSIQIIYNLVHSEIEDRWSHYRELLGDRSTNHTSTLSFLISEISPLNYSEVHKSLGDARRAITNVTDIDAFIKEFIIEFEQIVMPYISEMMKLDRIDLELNKEPLAFTEICPPFVINGLEFRKIIVAKLVDNPSFDELYDTIRKDTEQLAKSDQYMQKVLVVLDKVYKDLNSPSGLSLSVSGT